MTKIEQVIQRLQDYEFEQKAIYNFQIIEELLGEEKISKKLEVFVQQLADGEETSWRLLVSLLIRQNIRQSLYRYFPRNGIQCGNIFRGKIL